MPVFKAVLHENWWSRTFYSGFQSSLNVVKRFMESGEQNCIYNVQFYIYENYSEIVLQFLNTVFQRLVNLCPFYFWQTLPLVKLCDVTDRWSTNQISHKMFLNVRFWDALLPWNLKWTNMGFWFVNHHYVLLTFYSMELEMYLHITSSLACKAFC